MSAAPFDIDLVINRLRTVVVPGVLRQVRGAADFASMTAIRDFTPPEAFVLLAREKVTETKTGISLPGQQTALPQVVSITFGVVLAVRNYRQQAGAQLADELRQTLGTVRNVLLGWTPPVGGGRACQLVQGELTDYDSATALWTDVWRTQQIIKPEISA